MCKSFLRVTSITSQTMYVTSILNYYSAPLPNTEPGYYKLRAQLLFKGGRRGGGGRVTSFLEAHFLAHHILTCRKGILIVGLVGRDTQKYSTCFFELPSYLPKTCHIFQDLYFLSKSYL